MRSGTLMVPICAATVCALASTASADIMTFAFGLSGLQEVPPNASPATGTATVTLDTVTGDVDVLGSFSGLLAPATAAHIHGLAAPGFNAGVIVHLHPDPATSGALTGHGILTAPQVTGMIGGLTYINIHDSVFPGGEIRGQVVPGPAPLAVGALAGLAALRRRR